MTNKTLSADLTFYTIDEVAKILKVSSRTVQNRIKAGDLASRKFGGNVRISEQDLRDYIRRSRPQEH